MQQVASFHKNALLEEPNQIIYYGKSPNFFCFRPKVLLEHMSQDAKDTQIIRLWPSLKVTNCLLFALPSISRA
jgi:hypothetical protein